MKKTFINLIKSGVSGEKSGEEYKNLSADAFSTLIRLAKLHDVGGILATAVLQNEIDADEKTLENLKKEQYLSIMRFERLNYAYQGLIALFEQNQIPFIPLKGSVLREYYKSPYLRTSCDIDIFIPEKEVKKALILLEENGYTNIEKAPNDVGLLSPEGVPLELHFRFFSDKKFNAQMSDIWDICTPVEGYKFRYQMENSAFVFYHLAHMYKHFSHGGCGVRSFIDLWIIKNNFPFDREKLEKKLQNLRLKTFADRCFELSDCWFQNGEYSETLYLMEDYILRGGVYGTLSQRVAVGKAKNGGGFRYFMSRAFMPYSQLKLYYPILNKVAILYPFCLILRWFKALFGGGKKTAKEIKLSGKTTEEQNKNIEKMLKDLGL